MSTYNLGLINCPDIQRRLDEDFEGARSLVQDFTPIVNFLSSPANGADTLIRQVSPGGGKIRTVNLVYPIRLTEDDVSTAVAPICTSTNEAGMRETTCELDISVGAQAAEKITWDDLARICEDNEMYLTSRINALINGVRSKMETEVTDQVIAALGGFPSDDTEGVAAGIKTVQTLTAAAGTNLDAIEEIGYTKDNLGIPRLFTFGSGLITKYFKRLDSGCCLDTMGVDLASFAGNQGVVHSHAYRVPAAMPNANDFLGLIPGAAHLVYYNRYARPMQNTSYKKMTMVDPFTGIPFDVELTDDCGTLVLAVSSVFKVCTLPTDLFSINDRLNGVNGMFHFRVTNP